MKQHIILDKAISYPEPIEVPVPLNCSFCERKGYWKVNRTDEIMMLSSDPKRPQTKKYDVETGEDQKGQ